MHALYNKNQLFNLVRNSFITQLEYMKNHHDWL